MPSARKIVVLITLFSLFVSVMPAGAAGGALLEGQVLGEGGTIAQGYSIHLIGDAGQEVAVSSTDADGIYSFQGLDAGSYHLGVGNPEGGMAPVAGPPVKLAPGQLARRDLKVLDATNGQTRQAMQGNASLGSWWAGLTPAAKAWSVVAIVVVAGITVAALDDDDNETDASEN